MAKLYHFTDWDNKESIIMKGLRTDAKRVKDDEIIYNIFDRFRPDGAESFLLRSKCIFFYMTQCPSYEGSFGIVVDSDNLDPSRLYVLNYELAHQIYKGIETKIMCHEEIKVQDYEDKIKEYWGSMVKYSDYIKNHGDREHVEVLYFDSISMDAIQFINDQSPCIDRAQILLSARGYEVYNWERNNISINKETESIADVFLSGTEYEPTLTINYNSDADQETIADIAAVLNREFITIIKEKKSTADELKELMLLAQEAGLISCDEKGC